MASEIEWLESAEQELGTVYPGVTYHGCEMRKLPIRQVTVFYSPQADKVTILAVWNNRKDPSSIDYRLLDDDV